MDRLKIGLSALHFPLTIARYFWDALSDRDDCEIYSVGPFFGNWIPWTNVPGDSAGMLLSQRYVKTPTVCLPPSAAQVSLPYGSISNQLPDDLDLFLIFDAGWHFSDRPKAKIVALVETDPHVLKGNYALPKSYSDLVFCMQDCYREVDEIYLPYAYSKKVHYPMDLEKEYDVCLIGLQYPQRNELMKRLREKGLNIFYQLGVVFNEYRETFNKSKIGLNWSTLDDLNARFFEIPAMGLPMVTNHVSDADKFLVPNKDFLEFETTEQAENHIDNLLKNEEFRNKVANSGHKKVKEHTYDSRVQMILEACGLKYESV